MVVGYVEARYIDLCRVRKELQFYGSDIKSFSSTSVKFNQGGFADYNIFDLERLADELIPLVDERILEVTFGGNKDHLKKNFMFILVNDCCFSSVDVVEA